MGYCRKIISNIKLDIIYVLAKYYNEIHDDKHTNDGKQYTMKHNVLF